MKTVYWLSRHSRHGFVFLALTLIVTSCGSDSEGVPQNDISIKNISPVSPATLDFYETSQNDRVVIEYDYNISQPDGARIWVQPFNNGSLIDDYYYSSSSVFKGTGNRKVLISAGSDNGEVKVNQLRVKITSPDQSVTLVERYVDVDYTFK